MHHAIEFQLNNDPVLLFDLRVYSGVASVFFPLLQGLLTQRWISIELYEVLAEVLALLRHGLGAFEPFPPLNKNLTDFIHFLAMTAKRSDFS